MRRPWEAALTALRPEKRPPTPCPQCTRRERSLGERLMDALLPLPPTSVEIMSIFTGRSTDWRAHHYEEYVRTGSEVEFHRMLRHVGPIEFH